MRRECCACQVRGGPRPLMYHSVCHVVGSWLVTDLVAAAPQRQRPNRLRYCNLGRPIKIDDVGEKTTARTWRVYRLRAQSCVPVCLSYSLATLLFFSAVVLLVVVCPASRMVLKGCVFLCFSFFCRVSRMVFGLSVFLLRRIIDAPLFAPLLSSLHHLPSLVSPVWPANAVLTISLSHQSRSDGFVLLGRPTLGPHHPFVAPLSAASCSCGPAKVGPRHPFVSQLAVMTSWCHILSRVPHSTLQLQSLTASPWVAYLRQDLLRAENITVNMQEWWRLHCPAVLLERLLFRPLVAEREAYLQQLRESCDVWLDTPMYNSGVTGVEALAHGVPMVSVSTGTKFMQRAGGSVLRTAGLHALLAADMPHYERIATRLMLDPHFWHSITALDLRDTLLFQPSKSMQAFFEHLAVAHDAHCAQSDHEL
jgi:hypothetical protein